MPEKGTFLLAAIESGCSVFKCEGCGAVAIGKPGAGAVGACPDCETRALIVPIAYTHYSLQIQN